MGYSIDIFKDHVVDEEFLCSICQEVLKLPTMIEGCEHIFCTSCIQEWRATSNNTCPIDRQPIVGIRPPIRAFMNLYNKIQVQCGFDGCSTESTLGELESHISSCQYNPETIKPCAVNCGASIPMKELPTHNCIEYLKEKQINKEAEIVGLKNDLEDLSQSLIRTRQQNVSLMEKLRVKEAEIDRLKKEFEKKKEEEGEQPDRSKSKVTLHFEVQEISRQREQVLSPSVFAKNLSWRIMILPKCMGNQIKCIGFFLKCNGNGNHESESSDTTNWSCMANATLRLCTFKPDVRPLERKISHMFYSTENDWGYSNFIDWTTILDPSKGFVQNDTIRVEVDLIAG